MRKHRIYQVVAYAAVFFTALAPLAATAAPDESDSINRSAEPGVVLEAKASPADQNAFLAAAGPAAVAVKDEFTIPASVTAGQAALESNWGTSGLSKNDKNYFGFKCRSSGDPGPIAIGCRPYETTECDPNCHPATAHFRVYRSMTDSLRDYATLLTTAPRYAPALPHRNNPDEFIRQVAAAGYATDPNYAGKVINIMRAHNLYQLDSMSAPDADPSGAALHEVRDDDGSWTGFAPLGADARDVSIATLPDGSAQLVIIGADDVVYHRARHADGSWTDFAPLNGVGTGAAAKGKKVSVAGSLNGTAQVVIIGWDNVAYHRVRDTDGGWTEFASLGMNAKDVAVTVAPDGGGQVLAVGSDDIVYHRARHANGSWTDFAPLNGAGTGAAAKGKKVSIAAALNGSAQVAIVGWDGNVYHRARHADGNWTEFAPLDAGAKDVAIAMLPDGSSQTLIASPDDTVHHRVRHLNGSWTPWAPLAGFDAPAKAKKVSIAGGFDGSAQVVIIGV